MLTAYNLRAVAGMEVIMKSKWIVIVLCIALIGSTLAGCDLVIHADATQPINSSKLMEDSDDVIEAQELDSTYADGLNEFAYNIFSKLKGKENVFISPYSISMALSMLYNGADEKTRTEVAKVLGYHLLTDYSNAYSETANQYMNANSKYLMDVLQKADPKVEISIANSIWLAKDVAFQDTIDTALLAPVRNYYNADIFQVDFTKDKTLDQVNEWVSDKTEGMIDPFLEQFQDKELLRLFLANAIYFNGKWSKPFSPDDTRPEPFIGLNSTETVDMMFMNKEEYRYYSENGMRAIEIPYGNGSVVMNVLIPEDTENSSISEVYDALSTSVVNQFLEKLDAAYIQELGTLALPKFEMEYGTKSLNGALQELGMKDAFIEGEADFALIGDDLFVSQVSHKAKIQVEEWGTKAAAATGIEYGTTSALPEEPLQFIVNVPFIFFIRDKQTDSILFMGEMNQMN